MTDVTPVIDIGFPQRTRPFASLTTPGAAQTEATAKVNIDAKEALQALAYAMGAIQGDDGLPSVGRVIHIHPDYSYVGTDGTTYYQVDAALRRIVERDAAETARAAYEKIVVQLGPGVYDAQYFDFSDHTDVIVRGSGKDTDVQAAPSTFAGDWYKSVNFSGNVRCGIENMTIRYIDDGTSLSSETGAIMRNPSVGVNTVTGLGLRSCWMKDLDIRVEALNAGRTAQTWGIGYIPGDGTDGFSGATMILDRVDIFSDNSGVVPGEGEWHFHDCNIWFANTTDTTPPDCYGIEWQRGGRYYWWGGKITTGYQGNDPTSATGDIVGLYADGASVSGRFFMWDAVIFTRNEDTSPTGINKAVYFNDSNAGDAWLRAWNCMFQSETTTDDVPSVETDWHPQTNNVNRVELRGCRVSGITGNAAGDSGQITVSDSATVQSNEGGHWFCDTDTKAGDITLTLHTSPSVNTDDITVYNLTDPSNSYNVTIAMGNASDTIDGVANGTVVIPPGGIHRIRARAYNSGNLEWVTVGSNIEVVTQDIAVYVPGTISTGVQPFKLYIDVNASYERVQLVKMRYALDAGSGQIDFKRQGSNITNAVNLTIDTTNRVLNSGGGFTGQNTFDGNRFEVNFDTATTASDFYCTFYFERKQVYRGS